jgi:hypothetical protein
MPSVEMIKSEPAAKKIVIGNNDRVDSKKLLLYLSLSTLMLGILIYSGLVSTLFINLIPSHPDILDWWLISDAYWTGKPTPNVVFNYPPTFLILNLPLGLLDFPAAYFTFIFGTLFAYIRVIGYISKSKLGLILIIISVASLFNVLYGQNGFLTAALAGAALISLEHRRQVIAGILIDLLSIKPHLGLLFPIALLATKAWRAIIVAFITSSILFISSIALLGMNSYHDWFQKMNGLIHEIPSGLWGHVPTTFTFMQSVGSSIEIAYTGQIIVTILAMACIWKVWSHPSSWAIRSSILTTATCLTSPYLMTVDLTWLGLSLAWLISMAQKTGWTNGERIIFFLISALLFYSSLSPLFLRFK